MPPIKFDPTITLRGPTAQGTKQPPPHVYKNKKHQAAMRLVAEGLQQTGHPVLMAPALFGALMLMLGGEPETEFPEAGLDQFGRSE